MKFFFPDSTDLVDPTFDFETETRSEHRVRQRDDLYAHEVFPRPPFNGILVSKAVVDQRPGSAGRYTVAQRQRLLREGVRRFFRLDEREETRGLQTMGDCGAFSYVREEVPPYSVDDVLGFYVDGGFDYGMSVDHVILEYKPDFDRTSRQRTFGDQDPDFEEALLPKKLRERQQLTISLGRDFLDRHRKSRLEFQPYGVAQGWSPDSYAESVRELQKIGYDRIALGGVVPLKTEEVMQVLAAVDNVREDSTCLHLLGITRCEKVLEFQRLGVTSFDSTSALRQAFKDDRDNYHTVNGTYPAIRVPQVEANPKLQRRIRSGEVDQDRARILEGRCLEVLRDFDRDEVVIEQVLDVLGDYDELCQARDLREEYRRVLEDRPWRTCPCAVCEKLGIHVMLFRGAERNRRRGFHNLTVLWSRLGAKLAEGDRESGNSRSAREFKENERARSSSASGT